MGAVQPGRHFQGGFKIEVIPKNLEGENILRGEILGRGVTKGAVDDRKIEWPKKRTSKKFLDLEKKSRGAAFLRSAPGLRYPSYATG